MLNTLRSITNRVTRLHPL